MGYSRNFSLRLVGFAHGQNVSSLNGALSNVAGRVDLTWQSQSESRLRLAWRERDGPRIQRPNARRGFGSRLIERGLASNLGTVRLEYDPSGAVCVIDMPLWGIWY